MDESGRKAEPPFQAVAVIPAAGSGRRMGAGINKIWLTLEGESIISRTIGAFEKVSAIGLIVLAMNPTEFPQFERFLAAHAPGCPVQLVEGGCTRQRSVYNALEAAALWPGWRPGLKRLALIHDAARALVTRDLLVRSLEAGLEYQAAAVAVPVKDTIKQVDESGFVVTTLDRSTLWAVQTPQVFDFDLIHSCHRRLAGMKREFSDDCGLVEYCGYRVKLIPGSYENLKLTTPEDLTMAMAILKRRREIRLPVERQGFPEITKPRSW